MKKRINHKSINIVQDTDSAISVMLEAGKWLEESGKNPSLWWKSQNMNRSFLLKHIEPEEFFTVFNDGKPAAAVVLQNNERNQSWKIVDKDEKKSALYIHWLCVTRQFAGMNLPKIMVDFAKHKAQGKGFSLLRLDTNAHEAKLQKIYEDLGFKLVGIDKDTAFYQKELLGLKNSRPACSA